MSAMERVALGAYAMGTRFEIVLLGADAARLRAAGQAALAEIHRLEAQLSFYRPDSDISDLNRRAALEAVPVDPRLFRLLEMAQQISEETDGAFDITVAPLFRCWASAGATGRIPDEEQIADALAVTGSVHLILDRSNFSVQFARPGVMLDLGSIGKGYAIDCACEFLRENGFTDVLLHGGASSIYGLGAPYSEGFWSVAIRSPRGREEGFLAMVALSDLSLSVSAPHGKWLVNTDKQYGHVIDPRSGQPVMGSALAAVTGPSATVGDTLSTALLVLGQAGLQDVLAGRYGYGGMVCCEEPDGQLTLFSERVPLA